MISHSSEDKKVSDFVYDLLVFNGVLSSSIIYASTDNSDSRIPQKTDIFDYLREFFVESYSTEKIYVLYVASEYLAKSWPAMSEVGAGWIAQSDHDIFIVNDFKPLKRLDVDCEWATVLYHDDVLNLTKKEADKIAEKIIYMCEEIGSGSKSKSQLKNEIARIANIVG